ncbi:hypothetical protein DAEQUDRAFT_494600 [Daedalea quercina L-15889]|uniref:RING-type domain-containing protein n=1 Tax=Daedalea quercina L-15889 TaxID=1314783 RepID=A0A165MNA1_9APHY|nr:hypothetical protein DAEQUDRAFT_494600 [Daedalea quercina L-15889]
MDSDLLHDLTVPEPEVPLPLPTTVSSRSLQLRQNKGRSARSGSSSRSATHSASQSRASSLARSQHAIAADLRAESQSTTVHAESTSVSLLLPGPPVLEDTPADDAATEGPRKRCRLDGSSDRSAATTTSPTLEGPGEAAAMNLDTDDSMITRSEPEARGGQHRDHGDAGDSSFPKADDSRKLRDTTPAATTPDLTNARSASAADSFFSPVGQTMEAESSRTAQRRNVVIDVDALMDEFPVAGPSSATMRPGPSSKPGPAAHATPSLQLSAREPEDNSAIRGDEPLSAYSCPVCFSPPIRATVTPCGHVYCGECLFTAIKTTMQRVSYTAPVGERLIARCPVCRAPIPGWDGRGGGVVGLKPKLVYSL